MSINILLTQTHTHTHRDSKAHWLPCNILPLSLLLFSPSVPFRNLTLAVQWNWRLFLVLLQHFFLRLLSCFLSFVRSFARSGAPAVPSGQNRKHTHTHTYGCTPYWHIQTERDTCVRLSALCNHIFCRLHPHSPTLSPIPFTVCLFRIFALLWIFSVFCLSEYVYSIFMYIAVYAFIHTYMKVFSEIPDDEQA